jgi:hypothetical protein
MDTRNSIMCSASVATRDWTHAPLRASEWLRRTAAVRLFAFIVRAHACVDRAAFPRALPEFVRVNRARYPTRWLRIARTRDGTDYRIRPIRIEDAERDSAFIIHVSEASRHKRLMGSLREPSPALIDRFVRIDYQHDMAFVAVVHQLGVERIIGVARYSAVPHETDAEFAVAVADEWQSRGVGMTFLACCSNMQGARIYAESTG